MIFDTTYTDKEVTFEINKLVGKPFSFWKRIKLGGIGSHRIIVASTSESLQPYINPGHSTNYVNFELRPNGTIIHLKHRTQTYAWAIPFKQLKFDDTYEHVSDGEHSLSLKNPMEHNEGFWRKLVERVEGSE